MTRGHPLSIFVSFLSCSPSLNKAGISQLSQQSQFNLLYWFFLKASHSHQSIDRLPAVTGTHNIILLNILFLLLLCYSAYHCLENTNASPVNLVDSIFSEQGNVPFCKLSSMAIYKGPVFTNICL